MTHYQAFLTSYDAVLVFVQIRTPKGFEIHALSAQSTAALDVLYLRVMARRRLDRARRCRGVTENQLEQEIEMDQLENRRRRDSPTNFIPYREQSMDKGKHSSNRLLIAFATITVLGFSGPVMADFTLVFPAGSACEFDLQVDVSGSGNQVYREFFDKDGNLVRTLTAGTGFGLTFVNLGTGATLPLKANGAVTHVTKGPGGVDTWVSTGHNVIILFPTDRPPGPSTTLYVGRVVYTVDPSFTFTLLGSSGNKTDVCAALS
jgi:hypothetical protein